MLKNHANTLAGLAQTHAFKGGNFHAVDIDAARYRALERIQGAQQRALACAAGADNTEYFPGGDTQADV